MVNIHTFHITDNGHVEVEMAVDAGYQTVSRMTKVRLYNVVGHPLGDIYILAWGRGHQGLSIDGLIEQANGSFNVKVTGPRPGTGKGHALEVEEIELVIAQASLGNGYAIYVEKDGSVGGTGDSVGEVSGGEAIRKQIKGPAHTQAPDS